MSNISRRKMLMASAALSLVLAGAVPGPAVTAEPPARPNIVIFLADDLSYNDVGIGGDADDAGPQRGGGQP